MSDENKVTLQDTMLLDDIIQNKRFYHVFQPIYTLKDWHLFAYEALLRCEFFQNPELLFQLAMKKDRLYELDTLSIYHALTSIHMQYIQLFINVYPSTIVHPSFSDFLRKLKKIRSSRRNIVLEINESEKISDIDLLRQAIRFLRTNGFSVALDDLGKGEISLYTVMELEPDFVKLDRYYSNDLSISIDKQNEIQMILNVCQQKNIYLVLEGIEKPEDLAMAKKLGVHLCQGYLLGKPLPVSKIR
jgi:EAL domain-containing protein (putative c-di-GMP-specific phosphodiesterase class I)